MSWSLYGGLSWPARLSEGVWPWSTRPGSSGMVLTRGTRSGSRHVARRSGSQLRWLRNEGNRLGGLVGRIAPGPGSMLGFSSYESGPSGTPVFSHQLVP